MLQKKEVPEVAFDFNSPEIIAERNKLIAERIGQTLGYGAGKMADMCKKVDALSQDISPRKLLEYLYEKLWTAKPDISREDVQRVITTCHGEALDRLQSTQSDSW